MTILFNDVKTKQVFTYTDDVGTSGNFMKIDPLEDEECANNIANAVSIDDAFFPIGSTTHFFNESTVTLLTQH